MDQLNGLIIILANKAMVLMVRRVVLNLRVMVLTRADTQLFVSLEKICDDITITNHKIYTHQGEFFLPD